MVAAAFLIPLGCLSDDPSEFPRSLQSLVAGQGRNIRRKRRS